MAVTSQAIQGPTVAKDGRTYTDYGALVRTDGIRLQARAQTSDPERNRTKIPDNWRVMLQVSLWVNNQKRQKDQHPVQPGGKRGLGRRSAWPWPKS